jgi:hypothetical protein
LRWGFDVMLPKFKMETCKLPSFRCAKTRRFIWQTRPGWILVATIAWAAWNASNWFPATSFNSRPIDRGRALRAPQPSIRSRNSARPRIRPMQEKPVVMPGCLPRSSVRSFAPAVCANYPLFARNDVWHPMDGRIMWLINVHDLSPNQ